MLLDRTYPPTWAKSTVHKVLGTKPFGVIVLALGENRGASAAAEKTAKGKRQ